MRKHSANKHPRINPPRYIAGFTMTQLFQTGCAAVARAQRNKVLRRLLDRILLLPRMPMRSLQVVCNPHVAVECAALSEAWGASKPWPGAVCGTKAVGRSGTRRLGGAWLRCFGFNVPVAGKREGASVLLHLLLIYGLKLFLGAVLTLSRCFLEVSSHSLTMSPCRSF